ncbi:oligosaccharide flippase family protein [Paenibacillus sp. WC2504]|uniref:oligosaccharide flippase family protein n=1 Tax=Paenibacillus sp. WC2504 TaxID=3461403 RepID=UPI004046681F
MKLLFQKIFKKAFKVGFFHLLSTNLVIQIAGFSGQIFLTHILSVDDIGRIRVIQAFFSIFLIVATFGLNTAILKLSSEKISEDNKKELFLTGFKFCIITSLTVLVIVYALSSQQIISSDTVINKMTILYTIQLPIYVLASYGMSYLQSQKRIRVMSKLQGISKLIVIIISTVTAHFLGFQGYIMSLILTNFISFSLLFFPLKAEMKYMVFNRMKLLHFKKMMAFCGYAFGTSITWQLLISFGVILANFMNLEKSEIAYYGIASLVITTIMIIPNTVSQLMVPYISENTKDINAIKEIMGRYEKRVLLLMLVIILGSSILFPIFIPFAFGNEYKHSILYFELLLPGLLFWSLYSPKQNTLMSMGKIKYNFFANLLTLGASIVLYIISIKFYGVYGLAIGYSLTFLIAIFINNFYMRMAFFKAPKHINFGIRDNVEGS